jgi:hypothetical protein
MATKVEREIARLEAMDSVALRKVWQQEYDRPPPKYSSRDFLLRALAYRVQEKTEGGLSKATLKRLAELAEQFRNGKPPVSLPPTRLRPGTQLVREWRGEMHQVSVLEKGFEYRGTHYRSLSLIASRITGTKWSGPKFFGLRRKAVSSSDE